MTAVYEIDPLRDPRWPAFLSRHQQASVFHTSEWLAALQRTYGYRAVVFTTSAPCEELKNGIVFCQVQSWLLGCRMVSVPFSDHCQPLVDDRNDLAALLSYLKGIFDRGKLRYIEIRPRNSFPDTLEGQPYFSKSQEFYLHKLDLRPDLDELFRHFHKSCVQRRIQRAEREHLVYEAGRSTSILTKFYRLLLLTRRRHQLPPQPIGWFQNLVDCLGATLTIRVVSRSGEPVAGTLTLSYKESLTYKYGCSDATFHRLGGMPLLFWRTIQEGKELGAREFDLGRSDTDNPGLVAFKEHWNALGSKLQYFRLARPSHGTPAVRDWPARLLRDAVPHLPNPLLRLAGRLLYRHVA